jgi:hypothetical protein
MNSGGNGKASFTSTHNFLMRYLPRTTAANDTLIFN